jgi:hypothetical protein
MTTRPFPLALRSRTATLALSFAAIAVLGLAITLHARARPGTRHSEALIAASRTRGLPGRLIIEYPLDGTVFPPDIATPLCKWHDDSQVSDSWLVDVTADSGATLVRETVQEPSYRFQPGQWSQVQAAAGSAPVQIAVLGFRRSDPERLVAGAAVKIATSHDRVDAAIFFRQVPLPFDFANRHPERIRYSLGYVEGGRAPEVLLEGLPVCGNCHSFSRDGHTLGMDVDYANDKGSYVITPLETETLLTPEKIITWSDYRREDGQLTFGLLSQISPDARYVMSTVKDRSIFVGLPDRLEYSQLFFPIRGILAFYDRTTKKFQALAGADDPALVQSNPSWSPDGKSLLFARTQAYHSAKVDASSGAILPVAAASEFLQGKQGFQYDIYRIPFNGGAGGTAEPVPGASQNGMSNYFPRLSPDGKWLVYTQSKNFMLLQPDSKLFIVPAVGGTGVVPFLSVPRAAA